MTPCRCTPESHFREVVIHDDKGLRCVMVHCDDCADGREHSAARMVEPSPKPRGWRLPPRVPTLSEFVAALRRDSAGGSDLWWRVDPSDSDRRTPAQNAEIERRLAVKAALKAALKGAA